MRLQGAIIAVLFSASAASAQVMPPDPITVPESTPAFKPIVARFIGERDAQTEYVASWSTDAESSFRAVLTSHVAELDIWSPPGDHWVKLNLVVQRFEDQQVFVPDPQAPTDPTKAKPATIRILKSTEVKEWTKAFRVTDPRPPPIPVPPIPQPIPPQPTPPEPQPSPGKLSVLIMEDTSQRTKLPASQQAALFSKNVRDYLDSHCKIGPDGKTPEWRLFSADPNADFSKESVKWQGAVAQFRAYGPVPLPYMMISNGVTGTAGPFPMTEAETLALLRKWGGP